MLTFVDDAVDHRFRQVHPDNFTCRADMFRCRSQREAAEGVEADGNQYRQQQRSDADEEKGDLGVQIHGGGFRKHYFKSASLCPNTFPLCWQMSKKSGVER